MSGRSRKQCGVDALAPGLGAMNRTPCLALFVMTTCRRDDTERSRIKFFALFHEIFRLSEYGQHSQSRATRLLSMQNKHVFVSGEWEGNLRNRAGQVNDVIGPAYSGAKPQMRLPDKERNI
ncbi:MAG: hypothetical protein DMG15_19450 [Acidobacteria bacterium]|nr:MAG: hypothetical protein DMG15_19450 [Acidobacteriota bacterium]